MNICDEIKRTERGVIACRRNQKTGTIIVLYHAEAQGLDVGEPYAVSCRDHGSLMGVATQALATRSMTWPEWCEDCQMILINKGLL